MQAVTVLLGFYCNNNMCLAPNTENKVTMKKIILILCLFVVQITVAQEQEIRKSINTFFEGLHTADTIKIQSVCDDGLKLQSVKINKDGSTSLITEESNDFYKSVAAIPRDMKIEERLLDYTIKTDGAMAHVWTPYEFYINGSMSHKGVNSFMLYNDSGLWKIIYIIDTRRK